MNVRVERLDPLVLGQIFDVLHHHLVRMVVDKNVNATHLLDCLVNHLLAVLAVRQIGCVCVACLTLLFDELDSLLGVFFLLRQVRDEAVCAFHGVEDSDGASDAGIAAGDERFLALELASGFVEFTAPIGGGKVVDLWGRVQDGLPSWDLLVLDFGLVAWVCQFMFPDG
jgi:hypothetical protein